MAKKLIPTAFHIGSGLISAPTVVDCSTVNGIYPSQRIQTMSPRLFLLWHPSSMACPHPLLYPSSISTSSSYSSGFSVALPHAVVTVKLPILASHIQISLRSEGKKLHTSSGTLLIELFCNICFKSYITSLSSDPKNVIATPLFPALPVLPILWV